MDQQNYFQICIQQNFRSLKQNRSSVYKFDKKLQISHFDCF